MAVLLVSVERCCSLHVCCRAVGGEVYTAHVQERAAARQEYSQAVREGRTAAHVALR